jgi:hypothetical protein
VTRAIRRGGGLNTLGALFTARNNLAPAASRRNWHLFFGKGKGNHANGRARQWRMQATVSGLTCDGSGSEQQRAVGFRVENEPANHRRWMDPLFCFWPRKHYLHIGCLCRPSTRTGRRNKAPYAYGTGRRRGNINSFFFFFDIDGENSSCLILIRR